MRLGIALGVGLLIGLERERRSEDERQPAGIRTFTLVALLGGIAALLGTAALVVAGAAIVLLSVAGYVTGNGRERGLTTEVALFNAYFLGALAQSEPGLASALGVVMTILLAARGSFHAFARQILTGAELRDGLLLLAAAIVILPLSPDRTIDPWQAVNLRTVWRLAVVVMAISSAGYVAVRLLGPRAGLPLAGLAGGFVSSTATIGSMGLRSREEPSLRRSAIAAAVLSTVSTFVLLAIVLAATSAAVLRALMAPLAAGGLAALAFGAAFALSAARGDIQEAHEPARGRPFSLKSALVFALTVTTVMLVAAIVHRRLGNTGLVVALALAGLADAHAAAISMASLVATGQVGSADAVLPILAALSTNTLAKAIVAFSTGGVAFGLRVVPGLIVVLAAAWGALLLVGLR